MLIDKWIIKLRALAATPGVTTQTAKTMPTAATTVLQISQGGGQGRGALIGRFLVPHDGPVEFALDIDVDGACVIAVRNPATGRVLRERIQPLP